jgi:hypothetical protein
MIRRDANSQCCQHSVIGARVRFGASGRSGQTQINARSRIWFAGNRWRGSDLFDGLSDDHSRFILASRLHGPGPAKTK